MIDKLKVNSLELDTLAPRLAYESSSNKNIRQAIWDFNRFHSSLFLLFFFSFFTANAISQSPLRFLGEWGSGNFFCIAEIGPASSTLMIAGVADTNLLEIIDVSNPSIPQVISKIKTRAMVWDIECEKNFCYAAEMNYGMEIIDVTVPTAPKMAGRIVTDSLPLYIKVRDSLVFLGHEFTPLEILSVKDPMRPRRIAKVDTGRSYGFSLLGDSIFLPGAPSVDDWCIVDIKNPTKPQRVATVKDGSYSYSVEVDGRSIYAARTEPALSVFQRDAQGKIVRVAEKITPHIQAIAITPECVFIAGLDGVYGYQFRSGRLEMVYQEPELDASDIILVGTRVYVSNHIPLKGYNLRTYSISDPVIGIFPRQKHRHLSVPLLESSNFNSATIRYSINGRRILVP